MGLTAAYELAKAGRGVTVYEREASLGGLAGCFEIQGEFLEKFYHHIVKGDEHIIRLIKEVGLEGSLHWEDSKFGFYYVNKIYRFDSPLDILRFKPLNLLERFRMGLGVVRIRGIRDWRGLDRLSAREFVVQTMGERAYRVVWEPLFRSRFGEEHAERVSASWLWAKLNTESKSGARAVGKSTGYFKEGFEKLFLRLEERIIQRGGRVLRGTPVLKIETEGGRVSGVMTPEGRESFDRVAATVPVPVFLGLAASLPSSYRESLLRLQYLGIVCLTLFLKRSLTQSYWVNINDPKFPFLGIIEHTNLDPRKKIHGRHVVYIPKYTDPASVYFQSSREELLEIYLPYIQMIFPGFERSWIHELYLWKERYAQPLPTVGYADGIPPFQTPVSGLYLATMAQIYPQDRGMNNSVKLARELASQIDRDRSLPKAGLPGQSRVDRVAPPAQN